MINIFTNGCVRNFLIPKSQVGSLHFWDVPGIGWLLVIDISDYILVPLPLTSLTAHTTKPQFCTMWLRISAYPNNLEAIKNNPLEAVPITTLQDPLFSF